MKVSYSKGAIKQLGRFFRLAFDYRIQSGEILPHQANHCFKTLLSLEDECVTHTLSGRIGMDHNSLGGFFLIDREHYIVDEEDEIVGTIDTDLYRFVLINARYDDPEYIDQYTGQMVDLEDSWVMFIGIQFKELTPAFIKPNYSKQALESISNAICEDVHLFMQYGGHMPHTATDLYEALMTIEHKPFVEVLSGGVVEDKDSLLGFQLLDAPYQPDPQRSVVATAETNLFTLNLTYCRPQNSEVPSGYVIYAESK